MRARLPWSRLADGGLQATGAAGFYVVARDGHGGWSARFLAHARWSRKLAGIALQTHADELAAITWSERNEDAVCEEMVRIQREAEERRLRKEQQRHNPLR
jgi:hypothetical protein